MGNLFASSRIVITFVGGGKKKKKKLERTLRSSTVLITDVFAYLDKKPESNTTK